MTTRVYRVIDKENPDRLHLIRATSQARAIGSVTDNRFTCRVATQDDCLLGSETTFVSAKADTPRGNGHEVGADAE